MSKGYRIPNQALELARGLIREFQLRGTTETDYQLSHQADEFLRGELRHRAETQFVQAYEREQKKLGRRDGYVMRAEGVAKFRAENPR